MNDLIEELRDGHVLLSLLEVLLGTTLVSLFIVNACRFYSRKKKQQRKPRESPAFFLNFKNSTNFFQHSHIRFPFTAELKGMGFPFYSCTLINLFLSQRRSDERMPVNKLNNVATVLKLLEQSKVGVLGHRNIFYFSVTFRFIHL